MHRLSKLLAIASLVTLAACAGPQKRQDALEKRLATVETEVVALRAQVAESERARASSATQLDDKLEKISVSVAEVIRQMQARPPARPARPQADPTKTYAVPVGTSPVVGAKTAKVTIVFAGEYACPFCEKVRATLDELKAKYGDDLRIVKKSFIVHPQVATGPSLAACAAHKQGRWKEMDEALWERVFKTRQFEDDHLKEVARDLKLDMKRFEADFTGKACREDIDADQAMLAKLGVGATPAFFINGRFLSGAQPAAAFSALIDEEMKKANDAIKKGVKAKDYYDTLVKASPSELTK